MYSLIRKSAVLLSILTLLPLASASAAGKRVPLTLMDGGEFMFATPPDPNSAALKGDGVSTHMGKIVSDGQFNKVDRPSGCFKGEINGRAIIVDPDGKLGDELFYSLSAQFCPDPASPDPASPVFKGVGTYRLTGGTGRFERARGFGAFIGLADFKAKAYQCFLSGTISY